MLRLAYRNGILAAGQREMTPARLAWFEKPAADPTPQWPQHAIEGDWDRIHSVELAISTATASPTCWWPTPMESSFCAASPVEGSKSPAVPRSGPSPPISMRTGGRTSCWCGGTRFRGGGTRRRVDRELHDAILHLVIRLIRPLHARHELHYMACGTRRADQGQRIFYRGAHMIVRAPHVGDARRVVYAVIVGNSSARRIPSRRGRRWRSLAGVGVPVAVAVTHQDFLLNGVLVTSAPGRQRSGNRPPRRRGIQWDLERQSVSRHRLRTV